MMKRRTWGTLFVILMVLLLGQVSSAADPRKLLVAITVEPASLEPCLASAGNDLNIAINIAEYLISPTPSGRLEPGLATSWKASPDGKKIEFTLRKGVKFHSGDPFTAKDVQFSFQRAVKNDNIKISLTGIERFEIVDDYHLNIHFKTPDVTFIPSWARVLISSKSYYDRVGEDAYTRTPVGTGPYNFVRYMPGEYVDMERFEGYWGKKPQVREARFFYVSDDTTRASKLKAGEVDLILSCPYPMVKDFEKSPNFKLIKLDVNSPTKSVIFSTRNPKTPWHNKIVRQALAHAIDWKAINDNILYGIPNQLTYLAPWDLGYDPSLKPYIYDPQKAKELLAKAGYPNGFDLQLYYYIGRVYGDREMAQAVTGYFNAIGIRATPVEEEYIAGRARTSAAKKPDAVFVGLANAGLSGGLVVSKLRSFFHSQGANCVNSNPDLDKVIDEAISTFDDKKLVELIKKAQRIIYEDVPVIPISSYVAVYVAKKDVDYTPTKGYAFDLVFIKDVTFK